MPRATLEQARGAPGGNGMERDQRIGTVRGARRRAGLVGLALAAMVAAACGGDDDGGSSGVDGDKRLDELSADEAADICDWGLSLVDPDQFERLDCYLEALLSTQDAEMCEEVAQECIDNIEPGDPTAGECIFEEPPACGSEVSVAEIEACLRDSVALIEDVVGAVDCDLSPEDIDDVDLEQPASCALVEDKCPGLFEDEEDEAVTAGALVRTRWSRVARPMIR